jgi:hypothetical protein
MKQQQLAVASDLSLPADVVTETLAVLGKRGSGKTNLAVVLVEELVAAGLPVVVIDPVGVWWGLRSSADGKSAGLPVTILGGEHGDVPLEETSGAVIADFVIEARQPCIIDLALLRKGQQVRFMTAFAERLYHRKSTIRDALHVVIDEADAFAPQRPQPNEAQMLGAIEDLVRRGRSRGLGLTLITQRPASLNKNVLTQAEVLVVFQLVGPLDRKAIDEWVKMNGTDEERHELLTSIASLPRGTAWFWSPTWLKIFQKVAVRKRWTFDSSATPKAGTKRIEPKVLAPVDLDALRARIADTIERKKADDPKALRARIAELEKAVAAATSAAPTTKEVRVEVPVLDPLEVKRLEVLAQGLAAVSGTIVTALARVRAEQQPRPTLNGGGRLAGFTAPTRPAAPKVAHFTREADGWKPGKCERALIQVLGCRQGKRTTAAQLAALSGYSMTSSGFQNALGALRSNGIAVGGKDDVRLTLAGLELGPFEALPTGDELLRVWLSKLGKCERAILEALWKRGPRHGWNRAELADATGYSETSSGFQNALGALRTLELVNRGAEISLGDALTEAVS